MQHKYDFDPSYGYSLEQLQQIEAPEAPTDFAQFWLERYEQTLELSPRPRIFDTGDERAGWRVFDLSYTSTDRTRIGGWILVPENGVVRRGFVISHGYGGRKKPDFHLPLRDAVLVFPCCRGLGRSAYPPVSQDPKWHVLHDIHNKNRYIHGGCVEDIWMAVSALLQLYPALEGRIGYLGTSFGGGIGAMATAWDKRIQRAHLKVPSFGHHPLRISLPTVGSGASVQQFHHENPAVMDTLLYYDAAIAARYIQIPVHCACARFDPAVAPPGQFAIYNAIVGSKQLFIQKAGHYYYPTRELEHQQLLQEIDVFFDPL